jgi:uncharacterized membrane protein YedE/YeeE
VSESLAVALAIGIAFGAVLERTGLGSARQLVRQFHGTDLTVFKVMFSALVTAMLGVFWLGVFGLVNWSAVYVPPTFLAPQLVGGLVFGAGFALAGLCPGTSCVAAASGRGDGLITVAGLFGGVLVTGLALSRIPAFAAFYSSNGTVATLPEAFGASYGAVTLAVVVVALVGFALAPRIERHFGGEPMPPSPSRRIRVGLAAIALAAGLGAAAHGGPEWITPLDLARALRAGERPQVVDTRPRAAFDEFHVPGAVWLPEGKPLPRHALLLRGGADAWTDEILAPVLAEEASSLERSRWPEISELSRYFGGTPIVGGPGETNRRKGFRRGC